MPRAWAASRARAISRATASGLGHGEGAPAAQALGQGLAGDVLHHQVGHALVLVQVDDAHDPGRGQRGRQPRLAAQALTEDGDRGRGRDGAP